MVFFRSGLGALMSTRPFQVGIWNYWTPESHVARYPLEMPTGFFTSPFQVEPEMASHSRVPVSPGSGCLNMPNICDFTIECANYICISMASAWPPHTAQVPVSFARLKTICQLICWFFEEQPCRPWVCPALLCNKRVADFRLSRREKSDSLIWSKFPQLFWARFQHFQLQTATTALGINEAIVALPSTSAPHPLQLIHFNTDSDNQWLDTRFLTCIIFFPCTLKTRFSHFLPGMRLESVCSWCWPRKHSEMCCFHSVVFWIRSKKGARATLQTNYTLSQVPITDHNIFISLTLKRMKYCQDAGSLGWAKTVWCKFCCGDSNWLLAPPSRQVFESWAVGINNKLKPCNQDNLSRSEVPTAFGPQETQNEITGLLSESDDSVIICGHNPLQSVCGASQETGSVQGDFPNAWLCGSLSDSALWYIKI